MAKTFTVTFLSKKTDAEVPLSATYADNDLADAEDLRCEVDRFLREYGFIGIYARVAESKPPRVKRKAAT